MKRLSDADRLLMAHHADKCDSVKDVENNLCRFCGLVLQ